VRTQMPGAIELAYREHGHRLQRAVALYTGNPQIAEDAVAEAFALALAHATEVRDPLAWVWRVAFRLATAELKRSRRTGGDLPDLAVDAPPSVHDLVNALHKLSPKQRAAVVLHHYGGYSAREIAGIIDSSPGAVMVHVSQGRKRLRRLLEERDD